MYCTPGPRRGRACAGSCRRCAGPRPRPATDREVAPSLPIPASAVRRCGWGRRPDAGPASAPTAAASPAGRSAVGSVGGGGRAVRRRGRRTGVCGAGTAATGVCIAPAIVAGRRSVAGWRSTARWRSAAPRDRPGSSRVERRPVRPAPAWARPNSGSKHDRGQRHMCRRRTAPRPSPAWISGTLHERKLRETSVAPPSAYQHVSAAAPLWVRLDLRSTHSSTCRARQNVGSQVRPRPARFGCNKTNDAVSSPLACTQHNQRVPGRDRRELLFPDVESPFPLMGMTVRIGTPLTTIELTAALVRPTLLRECVHAAICTCGAGVNRLVSLMILAAGVGLMDGAVARGGDAGGRGAGARRPAADHRWPPG